MDKAARNKTKEHFFALRQKLHDYTDATQEMMTALRRAAVIHATALDLTDIDPLFLQLAPDRIPDRKWDRISSDYQTAMLETQALAQVVERLEEAALAKQTLTVQFILQLNRTLFERTRYSSAGKFRETQCQTPTNGHPAPHHSRLSEMLEHHLSWLSHRLGIFSKVNSDNFLEMFHIAAEVIYRLADTLPFEHGNARLGLAVGNYVMLFTGLYYNVIDISERGEYLKAIRKSSIDNLAPLVDFLIKTYDKTLDRIDGFAQIAQPKNEELYRRNLS
ncbi:MAG: Fic family protein [Candidatus Zixiibacteriota bacterium]|nr:MAG: Fic family protein [candidate division Zixibacteria bacterium]